MMTDGNIQQQIDLNGQELVTEVEREALIRKLTTQWTLDLSKRIESLAYNKSNGVKLIYFKLVQSYYQQVKNAYQNRAQQQQQLPAQISIDNVDYQNQQLNMSQQSTVSMVTEPQKTLNSIINQQPRFSSVQQSAQFLTTNPQATVVNSASGALCQPVRSCEPQKLGSSSLSTASYSSLPSSSLITASATRHNIDLSSNLIAQQQIKNTNLNDQLSQSSMTQHRYPLQQTLNSRLSSTMNSNGSFVQSLGLNNTDDVLHRFVIGNRPNDSKPSSASSNVTETLSATSSKTMPITNTSSTGDRLLQQILLSNSDVISNKISIQSRQVSLQQPTSSIIPQPIRSANTTNSTITNDTNSRSSLTPQQLFIGQPANSILAIAPPGNIQAQQPANDLIKTTSFNDNNSILPVNVQTMLQASSSSSTTTTTTAAAATMQNATLTTNNSSSPMNRQLKISRSGSMSSLDEETNNLIQNLKENLTKLQAICQKYTAEGHLDKARHAQAIYQQILQFINNPTHENLSHAKHIRDNLERAFTRLQHVNSSVPTAPILNNRTVPQTNYLNQVEKAINEYLSRDQNKRLLLNKLFVDPLNNVTNGFPHKKFCLDASNNSNKKRIINNFSSLNQSLLLSRLNDELILLSENIFLVEYSSLAHHIVTSEFNDDFLSKNGIILRCKLLEPSNPLVPPLRLRVSIRYPEEQPEILSLSQMMPPKLEFTDGHPFFEQISKLFVSYLFKLPSHYTVTDILSIWRQSIQNAV